MDAPDTSIYKAKLAGMVRGEKMNRYQTVIEEMAKAGYERETIRTTLNLERGYFSVLISQGNLTSLFKRTKQPEKEPETLRPATAEQGLRALLYGSRIGAVGFEARQNRMKPAVAYKHITTAEQTITKALSTAATTEDAAQQANIPYLHALLEPVALADRAAYKEKHPKPTKLDRALTMHGLHLLGYTRNQIRPMLGLTKQQYTSMFEAFPRLYEELPPQTRTKNKPEQRIQEPIAPIERTVKLTKETAAAELPVDYSNRRVHVTSRPQRRRTGITAVAVTPPLTISKEPLEQRIQRTAASCNVSTAFLYALLGEPVEVTTPKEQQLLSASLAYRLFAQQERSVTVQAKTGLDADTLTRIAGGVHEAGPALVNILQQLNGVHSGNTPYARAQVLAHIRAEQLSRTG